MAKINLLIPIAGKAQRFIDEGYTAPKPFIMVGDKHMIDLSLDSIDLSDCRLIFVVREDHIRSHSIDRILKEKYADNEVVVIAVNHITQGTLCTCMLAETYINNEDPLVIYTPDVHFQPVFKPQDVKNVSGLILTFKANSPAHSYAELDDEGLVVRTAEKEVISDQAAVGVYYFAHGDSFVDAANNILARQETVNGEYYVCPVYNYMAGDRRTRLVDKMYVLGTPDDLRFYIENTSKRFGVKPVALCCDHSGLETKEKIKHVLDTKGIDYIDFGTYTDTDCDHHDFLSPAIRHIQDGICDFGIGFCRSGQGFNIAANKHQGIRSALIWHDTVAALAIRHNCANFFCLPSQDLDFQLIIRELEEATFDGGRHMTRIQKIDG